MELFDSENNSLNTADAGHSPLAARMRPRTLDEFIGQDHIVGPGRLLRRAIAADQLTSVIFYGPPGTGKTTLARVIANHTKSSFLTLNAVLTGVQSIRDSIAQAEEQRKLYGRKTILFVDEVHRWNKSQQDALLPWVENGTIILVGATTENPFFEVNKALVSRSRVFQLKPLEKADLYKAARAACSDTERGYGKWNVVFEEGALEHLVETAGGDARSLLNALELAVETTPEHWPPPEHSEIRIPMETAEESIQQKVVLYDRDGDYHYDIISAFIKSLRGRDPDAAMYWLARMVAAGENPRFIFRRMIISACEDTGLADPYAIAVVESCAAAFDRVGLPEGRYHLAHAALYLATAPKSNSSMAFFDALAAVEKEDTEVPNHLRDGSRDAEGFGHGAGYMYPHAYRDHWVAQQYLPDALTGRVFYTPSEQGYEKTIRNEVLTRRELQIAAILEDGKNGGAPDGDGSVSDWWTEGYTGNGAEKRGESLTFSPGGKARDEWARRTDSGRSEALLTLRNTLCDFAALARHERSLIWNADDGLLLWEISRRTPEGFTAGMCRTEKGKQILEQYASTLNELDRPVLAVSPRKPFSIPGNVFGGTLFDRIFFRDPFTSAEDIESLAEDSGKEETRQDSSLACPYELLIAQKIPCRGMRLSRLLSGRTPADEAADPESSGGSGLFREFTDAETAFFSDTDIPLFSWDDKTVKDVFDAHGFSVQCVTRTIEEKKRMAAAEIDKWFDPDSRYGGHIVSSLGKKETQQICGALKEKTANSLVPWHSRTAFFRITKKQPLPAAVDREKTAQ